MWNSWYFRTDVRRDEVENVNELTDSFFIDFDVILCVAIERLEHFDDIDSDIDADHDIDFDVAREIDEANEQLNAAISTRFDVKSRVTNIVAIFVCFDVISCDAIVRFERIDDIDLEIVAE